MNGVKQNSNKMTSWDSDDKLHPQGAQVKTRDFNDVFTGKITFKAPKK